jgi:hypothetical protein
MEPGTTLDLGTRVDGPIHLEIRVARVGAGGPTSARRLRLAAVGPDSSAHAPVTIEIPATVTGPWQVVVADLDLAAGDRLRLEALDAVTVQSVRGFLPAAGSLAVGSSPIPGWRVTVATPDAVVLEPIP